MKDTSYIYPTQSNLVRFHSAFILMKCQANHTSKDITSMCHRHRFEQYYNLLTDDNHGHGDGKNQANTYRTTDWNTNTQNMYSTITKFMFSLLPSTLEYTLKCDPLQTKVQSFCITNIYERFENAHSSSSFCKWRLLQEFVAQMMRSCGEHTLAGVTSDRRLVSRMVWTFNMWRMPHPW